MLKQRAHGIVFLYKNAQNNKPKEQCFVLQKKYS